MTPIDLQIQSERIAKFRRLEERALNIRWALAAMEEPKVQGSGPFTGNTRESRRVDAMRLCFSPTLGGAPAVELDLNALNISASSFGMWLERELRSQLESVTAEQEKL